MVQVVQVSLRPIIASLVYIGPIFSQIGFKLYAPNQWEGGTRQFLRQFYDVAYRSMHLYEPLKRCMME